MAVAVRYPAFDAAANAPITLEQRINRRVRWQQAPALAWAANCSLSALIGTHSRSAHRSTEGSGGALVSAGAIDSNSGSDS
jgi:hypothetical protein